MGIVCGPGSWGIFRAEDGNLRFSDFKWVVIPYQKTPDMAVVRYNRPFTLKAVGELKVPTDCLTRCDRCWAQSHHGELIVKMAFC